MYFMWSIKQNPESISVRSLALVPVLLILIGIFFYKNILGARPAIPFDLFYRFPPWENGAADRSIPQNFELSDQAVQFHPWWTLIVDEVMMGRLPLWNPYSFCGSPLFANGQSGLFYPLKAVNFIFPTI